MCLQQFIIFLEPFDALLVLGANILDGALNFFFRRSVVAARENSEEFRLFQNLASQRINPRNSIDVIAEKLHSISRFTARRKYINHVAFDAKRTARKVDIVTMVLNIHQLAQKFVLQTPLAALHRNRQIIIIRRRTKPIDAADARHDNHVAPCQQSVSSSMAQAVDFFVDCRIFLDIGIARRDVSFWLVIIKIADEIMNFVVGEKLFEFAEQLGSESFVVRQNQRRHVPLSDNVRHCKSFTTTCYTE